MRACAVCARDGVRCGEEDATRRREVLWPLACAFRFLCFCPRCARRRPARRIAARARRPFPRRFRGSWDPATACGSSRTPELRPKPTDRALPFALSARPFASQFAGCKGRPRAAIAWPIARNPVSVVHGRRPRPPPPPRTRHPPWLSLMENAAKRPVRRYQHCTTAAHMSQRMASRRGAVVEIQPRDAHHRHPTASPAYQNHGTLARHGCSI